MYSSNGSNTSNMVLNHDSVAMDLSTLDDNSPMTSSHPAACHLATASMETNTIYEQANQFYALNTSNTANAAFYGGIPCPNVAPSYESYGAYAQPESHLSDICQNVRSQAITITLQYGSQNETVFIERTHNKQLFGILQQKALHVVDKYQKDGKESRTTKETFNEILLYLHDYNSPTLLQHLTSLSQLDNGSVVEIIRVDRSINERPTRPHCLEVNNYITPTFCDYCGEMLVGLIKQGLQCKLCKCNFHKRCALAPRNDCAKADVIKANAFLVNNGMSIVDSVNAQIPNINTQTLPQFQLPHTLSFHNYKTPTVCKVCDKILLGFIKQGLKCRDCRVNVHKKCAVMLPNNCQIVGDDVTMPFSPDHSINRTMDSDSFLVSESQQSPSTSSNVTNFAQMSIDKSAQSELMTCSSNEMIPLARLPGSAASRLVRPGPLCEGWMIHFTIIPTQPLSRYQEPRRLRHYWILTNESINMYNEYNDGVNLNRVYKQINLAEIIALMPYNGSSIYPNSPPHCFEIRTVENVIYCIGEKLDALVSDDKNAAKLPKQPNVFCMMNWQGWFKALQQALQPPALRTDPVNVEPAVQFTQLYQIFRDKILGSGQFGTVYFGVHRLNKKEVAIKVIAKDRFTKRANSSVETLKTEVAILRNIDHHGIIKLENMFETKDKIFVVMEKMSGDMLEMILSQANGRLNERCTKFLIIQILSALRYLHYRGIAHCDLKPENVLLSNADTNFPQTKLCDFGYARFIDDTQFRQTIVGTPAYLAPEVLKRKGYNKSLDMWSVGVIIYVTLSGTFPFNDGEEISDQIHNASFMFPSDIWDKNSKEVISLIQNLLRVQIEERLTIDECMSHSWMHDSQVYVDLQKLEQRLSLPDYLSSEWQRMAQVKADEINSNSFSK